MLRVDPIGQGKVFVDVGCNSGVDAVSWLELWGTTPGVQKRWGQAWVAAVKNGRTQAGSCQQNKHAAIGSYVSRAEVVNTSAWANPAVICVEAQRANVALLGQLSDSMFGKHGPFR